MRKPASAFPPCAAADRGSLAGEAKAPAANLKDWLTLVPPWHWRQIASEPRRLAAQIEVEDGHLELVGGFALLIVAEQNADELMSTVFDRKIEKII